MVPGRLEKAKHEIRVLIHALQGDRVGLVVFAGTSLVNCPLTIDQNAVKLFLDVVDTQVIPRPGSNIGDAIRKGIQAFDTRDRRHKVMVSGDRRRKPRRRSTGSRRKRRSRRAL